MSTLVSVAECLTARTPEEVRSALLAAFIADGVQAGGWSAFSDRRALLEFDSRFLSLEEGIRATIAAAGYLDTAAIAGDDWVDLLAKGFFRQTRSPASSAVHRFVLTNQGGAGPFTVSQNAIIRTDNDLLFKVQTQSTLGSGVNATADVIVYAAGPGAEGNIPVGSNLSWLGSGLPGVAITNPAIGTTGTSLIAAGADAERSSNLIARCVGRWAATSYGGARPGMATWIGAAFEEAGLSNTVTKHLVDDANPNGPGSMDLYLANDGGPATASELAIVSPYVLARQTLGTGPWRVLAAASYVLPLVAKLFAAGNPSAVADAASALVALQAVLPLGGVVYRAEIIQRLMAIPGVYNVTLATPAADVLVPLGRVVLFSPTLTLG